MVFDIAARRGVIDALRLTPFFRGNTSFGVIGELVVLQHSPIRFGHIIFLCLDS